VDTPVWNEQEDKIKHLIKTSEQLSTGIATLSMAWVLSNMNIISAITAASRPEQIHQTIKAIEVYRRLTLKVLDRIEGIFGNKPTKATSRFCV